jgi:hypothetical protein
VPAFGADVSKATINVSGNVPVVFSVTARGYPGDLDLNTGTVVVDRLMGILHFKYNVSIASIFLESSTASGLPKLNGAGADYAFAAPMYFKANDGAGADCPAIDDAVGKLDGATVLTNAGGLDVTEAGTTVGDYDCHLTASWTAAATIQPAGKYSMTITVIMTST